LGAQKVTPLPSHSHQFLMSELQQARLESPDQPQRADRGVREAPGNDGGSSQTGSPFSRASPNRGGGPARDGSPSRQASPSPEAKGLGLKRRGSMVIQHCRSKSQRLEDTQGWSSLRLTCWKCLRNEWLEATISSIVCFNLVLIIYEADYEAQCFPDYFGNYKSCPFKSKDVHWVATCNLVLLIIYTLEATLRVYVFRKRFPFSWWNQLDVLVCTTGWIGIAFDGSINLAFLRIVRVGRLARAFRFLFRIRELYLLVNGVVSSLKAIFFGTMLLMVMLVAYSIILVEWVHPNNSQITYSTCSECTTAFRSVWWSTITLFKQVIAGDSWIVSYPLIERQPGVAFVMMVIVVTVSLGMINLILTVIVERAAEARERDVAENVKQKQKAQETVKHELLKICEEMDDDEDGQLSAEELRWAYQDSEAFRNVMMTLDIRESDLESVFKVLDSDGTGELEYHEFCEELVQLQGQDVRVMVALTRQRVSEILAGVERLDRKIMDSNQAQDAKLDFLWLNGKRIKRHQPSKLSPTLSRQIHCHHHPTLAQMDTRALMHALTYLRGCQTFQAQRLRLYTAQRIKYQPWRASRQKSRTLHVQKQMLCMKWKSKFPHCCLMSSLLRPWSMCCRIEILCMKHVQYRSSRLYPQSISTSSVEPRKRYSIVRTLHLWK